MPAAELGTPFNAEIERLQRLVSIASREACWWASRPKRAASRKTPTRPSCCATT